MVLIDGQLTMLRCDHKVAIRSHDFIDTLAPELYDQFGCIPAAQCTVDHILVTEVQLQHGVHSAHFLGFLAARDLVQTTCTWDSAADALNLDIHGDANAVHMVSQMWLGSIPADMLHLLDRQTKIIQKLQWGDFAFPACMCAWCVAALALPGNTCCPSL